jgi:ABC-type transport system involved in cytochrome c biogenesis permease subunit
MSYGALALSWIMSNLALIKVRFGKMANFSLKSANDAVYTCVKVGIVLLAAGIILGGVWADYSWGRFWGWDPKETWSLIALCIYMIILHGKYTSWISPTRFIPAISLAFLSIMMAWFGVNYILAAGLHSYGFSEGGAIFLGSFFAFQIILVLSSAPKFFRLKSRQDQTA